VPVLPATLPGLADALASLSNQTVSGFETVLVHPMDLDVAPYIAEASARIRIAAKAVPGKTEGLAALLNAGIAAARDRRISYLIPGNVFYPYHLEVLSQALDRYSLDAAYCAWSVYSDIGGKERWGAVSFDQAEPIRLPWGDWAPLVCWMHERAVIPAGGFDESFLRFPGWQFVLRLAAGHRFHYLRRVTVELRSQPEPSAACSLAVLEAERILGTPREAWQHRHRKEFLDAVRKGCWEQHLAIDRNQVLRRARRLVGSGGLARFGTAQVEAARARLDAIPPRNIPPNASGLPNIFLFSIIEWTALTQRPHHFARGLASRGYRVFWIDVGLKPPRLVDPDRLTSEIAPGLHYVELPGDAAQIYHLDWSPAVLDLMAAVIERIGEIHCAQSAIQLVTFPKWDPLVSRLRDRFGWPIVYDCLDDQQAFGELYKQDAAAFEDHLVEASSVLITTAHNLFERYRPRHANTRLIPNAVDYETFRNAKPGGLLDRLPRPVIGFFGAFADWLDLDWIAEAARCFPHWSFVYIGRETFATIESHGRWRLATAAPNITVLPQMDVPNLARYLAEFDVCTMPFQDLPITRAMNPVKIYEYLAAGKPVVAPDLPETRPFARAALIATYSTFDESFRLLRDAALKPGSESQVAARMMFAAANTWSQRLDLLTSLFQGLAR
jgi:glycosyltransferase involved in cell wall biosynthesis